MISKELAYTAVRYAYGLAEGGELSRAASQAFDKGLSSPSLAQLTTATNSFEQKELFETALRELGYEIPTKNNSCVFDLLRYHIESIANGSVSPKKGLDKMMQEVFYPVDIHNQTPPGGYVGSSHGIERLVGLYWEYVELYEREIGLDKQTIEKGYAELDKETLAETKKWLEKYPR